MRRSIALLSSAAVALLPSAAYADSKMPQMDFSNPLTGAQIVWMAVILIVLYFLLARWALPQVGRVIENRQARITADLETARAAKASAEQAVHELNLAIRNAREASQAEIAKAVDAAKHDARARALELNARLDAQIGEAEAEIDRARQQAIAALPPVARDVAASLLQRLTGTPPDPARIERTIAAMSA